MGAKDWMDVVGWVCAFNEAAIEIRLSIQVDLYEERQVIFITQQSSKWHGETTVCKSSVLSISASVADYLSYILTTKKHLTGWDSLTFGFKAACYTSFYSHLVVTVKIPASLLCLFSFFCYSATQSHLLGSECSIAEVSWKPGIRLEKKRRRVEKKKKKKL